MMQMQMKSQKAFIDKFDKYIKQKPIPYTQEF